MKRVLGIVASPRNLGNSEILMKAAMEASGADELDMIRLTKLNLKQRIILLPYYVTQLIFLPYDTVK